jgi:hypothetical protein
MDLPRPRPAKKLHSDNNLGRGIAVLGIWVATAVMAWHIEGFPCAIVSFFAMIATMAVWK